jgi:hypothetical protein
MQNRLVAILAYEKVGNYAAAQIVLDRERERQNATVCRTTALSPNARWQQALLEKRTATRPCPLATLLDLHLALHWPRRVNSDNQVRLSGPELAHRPNQAIHSHAHSPPVPTVLGGDRTPTHPLNVWPEILGNYSL